MDRDKIFEVISRHLRDNVEEMEDVTIEPGTSMADYGASSLDMVEVVSCSIRELGIKVPRTELANAKNLGELVDLFMRSAEKVPQ